MNIDQDFAELGPDAYSRMQDRKMTRALLGTMAAIVILFAFGAWQREAGYDQGVMDEHARYLALRDAVADKYGPSAAMQIEHDAETAFYLWVGEKD
jgi:hypothetical protein